jgi:hypothetical protein
MRISAHFWNSSKSGTKGVGVDDVGPGGARRLETPVEVLEGLFHPRAHVSGGLTPDSRPDGGAQPSDEPGRRESRLENLEIESGKQADRPQLERALAACRIHKATLVIAKLHRLARDAHFLLGLERSSIAFTAADMPNANRLTVGIMAMVAEEERRAISERTKAALAAAKARGVKLGGRPENLQNTELGWRRSAETRRARAGALATDLDHPSHRVAVETRLVK